MKFWLSEKSARANRGRQPPGAPDKNDLWALASDERRVVSSNRAERARGCSAAGQIPRTCGLLAGRYRTRLKAHRSVRGGVERQMRDMAAGRRKLDRSPQKSWPAQSSRQGFCSRATRSGSVFSPAANGPGRIPGRERIWKPQDAEARPPAHSDRRPQTTRRTSAAR